ncbi:MAG TPA: OmpA family protein, partial [Bacteroidia bacterium]|nr:OmpA family protein [Bacteroidia bacterium]
AKYPEAKLSVEGHTDNTGNPEKNVTLSQKRCESVKNYLVSKGIDANRLTATGYGDTRPIADNKTADGRAKNRRVELKTQY